jgi:hypothetical protein
VEENVSNGKPSTGKLEAMGRQGRVTVEECIESIATDTWDVLRDTPKSEE